MAWKGKGKASEWFRKKLVYLKRNTKIIPFLFIIVSCMVFTFKLSGHSSAATQSTSNEIALYMFCITLASIMSIIAFVGFKKFNKKGMIPFLITLALLVLQLVFDFIFKGFIESDIPAIIEKMETASNAGDFKVVLDIFNNSVSAIKVHIVFLCITIGVMLFLPVLQWLFNQIDTALPEQEVETEDIGIILEEEI